MLNYNKNNHLSSDRLVRVAPGGYLRSVATCAFVAITTLASTATLAAEGDPGGDRPLTIDDLGFNRAMNANLFSGKTVRIRSASTPDSTARSLLPGSDTRPPLAVSSMMEIESARLGPINSGGFGGQNASGLVLDTRYQGLAGTEDPNDDDGLTVKRFSTAIRSSGGTLTVGSDWSNFQDFLSDNSFGASEGSSTMSLGLGIPSGVTADQVRWQGGGSLSGLSVAIENDLQSSLSETEDYDAEPNLVVSWRGGNQETGRYRFSALGRNLDNDDSRFTASSSEADSSLGWGLNLAGGWRFGDLVAKLSVTLGNSIDNFILGRLGDSNTAAAATRTQGLGGDNPSFNINPSLDYQLGEQSNLHLSVNRFQTTAGNAVHGVDTLDTIHVGYSWNPWPSTRFGIEFVGKDVEGNGNMEDSNTVNFAASKRF